MKFRNFGKKSLDVYFLFSAWGIPRQEKDKIEKDSALTLTTELTILVYKVHLHKSNCCLEIDTVQSSAIFARGPSFGAESTRLVRGPPHLPGRTTVSGLNMRNPVTVQI